MLVLHAGTPLAGQQVTLMGGWTDSAHTPPIWRIKQTKASGKVSFKLPSAGTESTLSLTIVPAHAAQPADERPNFKPYVGEVSIKG